MTRISRTARAALSVTPLDRLLLDLHGTVQGGDPVSAREAWDLVRDELIGAALERWEPSHPHLPEAWWRFQPGVPDELRPLELGNGRTASYGDLPARRAAWVAEHRGELGLP